MKEKFFFSGLTYLTWEEEEEKVNVSLLSFNNSPKNVNKKS